MNDVSLTHEIRRLVEDFREKTHTPAVLLGIVGGPGQLAEAMLPFGTLDPDPKGAPPTPDTTLAIGSVTKTFTATALIWLARQADRGNLHLDDPAQKYLGACAPEGSGVTLPVWPTPPTPIRLRDLASNTSGFKADHKSTVWQYGIKTKQRLFEEICRDGQNLMGCKPPGTTFAYVNAGWELLGTALANYRNYAHYNQLLQELLAFGQLSMPSTAALLDRPIPVNLAPAYRYDHGTYRKVPFQPGEWLIWSTLRDMMVWLRFNMGLIDSPLKPLLGQLQSPQITTGAGTSACFGWFSQPIGSGGQTRLFKNGAGDGFYCYIAHQTPATVPQNDKRAPIGVVLMANLKAALDPLGIKILDLLNGDAPGVSD